MEMVWVIFFVQAIVFGGFSAFIAKEKNRDSLNWLCLGFLFGIVAFLALLVVPKIDATTKSARRHRSLWYQSNAYLAGQS